KNGRAPPRDVWRYTRGRAPLLPTLTAAYRCDAKGFVRRLRVARLIHRGVEDRPEVDRPSQQEEPEDGGKAELEDRHEQPSLEKLAESRYEEAAQRRDDVSGGALTRHVVPSSAGW